MTVPLRPQGQTSPAARGSTKGGAVAVAAPPQLAKIGSADSDGGGSRVGAAALPMPRFGSRTLPQSEKALKAIAKWLTNGGYRVEAALFWLLVDLHRWALGGA